MCFLDLGLGADILKSKDFCLKAQISGFFWKTRRVGYAGPTFPPCSGLLGISGGPYGRFSHAVHRD